VRAVLLHVMKYGADIVWRFRDDPPERPDQCEENVPADEVESTKAAIEAAGGYVRDVAPLSVNTRLCRMENSAEL
jgi:hypothetical protein